MIFMVNYTTTMTKAGQHLGSYLFKCEQNLTQRTLDQYKQNSSHAPSKMQITLLIHHLLLIWVGLSTAQA